MVCGAGSLFQGGDRRKFLPNPYSNISKPSQLLFQESHLEKLDNTVWAGYMRKAIYCCMGTSSGFQEGVRRKLPPNPYINISRPSQLRIQESHLGKADKYCVGGLYGES